MAISEELIQKDYIQEGALKPDSFGKFLKLDIGATNLRSLNQIGFKLNLNQLEKFSFSSYQPPKDAKNTKPDQLFLTSSGEEQFRIVAVGEVKTIAQFDSVAKQRKASEQALFSSIALGAKLAIAHDGSTYKYIDVEESIAEGDLVFFSETRQITPGVLEDLTTQSLAVKDPTQLAQRVWQEIWHSTKSGPEQSLLTFVELFILKFLSDCLSSSKIPNAKSFYELVRYDESAFIEKYGKTQIEYYVQEVRPTIKALFPESQTVKSEKVKNIFGLQTMISKASVINGFAFLRSSGAPISSFNRPFLKILKLFSDYGSLSRINPEFKLRLYETFLSNTPSQQSLGQFFTPRNVVKEMVRMADIGSLASGSILLDPASGVGGFVLEPELLLPELKGNLETDGGNYFKKISNVGVDVDESTQILAKANYLIHHAEALKDDTISLDAINAAMADTFILMNDNETLGTLEFPPQDAVDVILANPPYVTKGSATFREEMAHLEGLRNGLVLSNYYGGWGLGLEALFTRYISGALKPGARALFILPLGFLNRSEPRSRERLLAECNIEAVISLPRNTFFNTSQATAILILRKRHNQAQTRPNVLCAIPQTIGETLDRYRAQTTDNQLSSVTDAILARLSGAPVQSHDFVKLVSAEEFGAENRWDPSSFWTNDELEILGVKAPTVCAQDFYDEVVNEMKSIVDDIQVAKKRIEDLDKALEYKTISLANETTFRLRAGKRVRTTDIAANPGDLPVYSCFTKRSTIKGLVDPAYIESLGYPVEEPGTPIITVAANGAVGAVFVRDERCFLTDDLIAIEVLIDELDTAYVASAIKETIEQSSFYYEAKLFQGRLKQLSIRVPIRSGVYSLEDQLALASARQEIRNLRERLSALGDYAEKARVSLAS